MYKVKVTYQDFDGTIRAKILNIDFWGINDIANKSQINEYQIIKIENFTHIQTRKVLLEKNE